VSVQGALVKRLGVVLPLTGEPGDRRCRQPRGGAEELFQRGHKVTLGHPIQVQQRQHLGDRRGPLCPRRQNRRGEPSTPPDLLVDALVVDLRRPPDGSVALFERGACRGGTKGLCWSDGGSEFVEGGGQPEQWGGVAASSLWPRRRFWMRRALGSPRSRFDGLQPSHRPEPGLQSAVVAFDAVVLVLAVLCNAAGTRSSITFANAGIADDSHRQEDHLGGKRKPMNPDGILTGGPGRRVRPIEPPSPPPCDPSTQQSRVTTIIR
jgi:hypothetical protein